MQDRLDDKYSRILNASIEVISEKGLEKSSVSEIVKKAGIAQGTFYLYFSSKSDLVPAIAKSLLTKILDRMKRKVQGGESFWSTLGTVIDETFKVTDEHKDIIVLVYSGLAVNHSLEKWEEVYRPYYEWLEIEISKAVQKEEIYADINVKWTSRTIINLIENAAERYYIGGEQDESLTVYKEELFKFIRKSLITG
ncbi:TetR family transcriptional regulator [Cytobacillus firmus]|uniref:TetR family transcriptional regulator n=1 Tax=Cytobacillus firmus TaxID=1399 RepID=UPI0022284174|nr:TetR family transcriptional regulator [Cytobacillus firmus]